MKIGDSMQKKLSQLDPGGVLKSAHDFSADALRTISGVTSVPSSYSRVDLSYNGNGSVTRATFYGGSLAESREVQFTSDTSGSLNNTYFTLYSEFDESLYHVWYNVDGLGTDPAPVNSLGIEVLIQSDDVREIVKLATQRVLEKIEDFNIKELSPISISITNSRKGVATNTVDVGTGFTIITVQEGEEVLIKNIDIPFTNNVRYIFNTQERKFEVESIQSIGTISVELDADDGSNVAVSRHENPRNITGEEDYIDTELDTQAYTQIISYTSVEDLRIRNMKIKGDTLGVYRIKINGTLQDYFRTSNFERNCLFAFIEEIDLTTGQVLTIEFIPERLRLDSYNFFYRIEGYIK